jgi:hypothetical protein
MLGEAAMLAGKKIVDLNAAFAMPGVLEWAEECHDYWESLNQTEGG